MPHFSPNTRNTLLEHLLQLTQSDPRTTGGALVGSFAKGTQDQYSDLDITIGIQQHMAPIDILNEWTAQLQKEYAIVHHFDVPSGGAIYRVLLFDNGMEVDLSAVPEKEYGPKSPNFKLLFGQANDVQTAPPPSRETLYGWGWHHVLHANGAIKRGKFWQAEFWISSLRNHLITLQCLRYGLPHQHSRGADQLPQKEKDQLATTLLHSLAPEPLHSAMLAAANILLDEIKHTNSDLAAQLKQVFANAFED